MTVLGSLLKQESRTTADPWGVWQGDAINSTWSGASVTTESSLQLLTVYGCVRLISDSIATLPLDVFRKRPDGSREEITVPDWLETPVIGLPRVAWMSQILSSLLLAGNSYLAVMRSQGRIVELVPLDPAAVKVERVNTRKVVTVLGKVPPYDILHIPALMLAGQDVGVSPIEAARQSIGLGMAAQEFGAKYFGQGAVLAGVIETPQDMTPDNAKGMARAWDKTHGGAGKAHKTGVLVGGAQWKPTAVSNEQAQFLETRGYTAGEIAGQMFLLDPSDLGIPVNGVSLTYANLTERNKRRFQVALLPWVVRLEAAVSSLLAPEVYMKLNPEGLLRGDQKARYDAYKVGLDEDFLQVEEIRAWEELPPLPARPSEPPDLAGQIEAVGQLIRAGFDPAAALALFGLPPIAHTGLVPVTVTNPDNPTAPGG